MQAQKICCLRSLQGWQNARANSRRLLSYGGENFFPYLLNCDCNYVFPRQVAVAKCLQLLTVPLKLNMTSRGLRILIFIVFSLTTWTRQEIEPKPTV